MKPFEAKLRGIPQRNALKLWIPAGVYPRAGGDGDDEKNVKKTEKCIYTR
jgi:hypothetical protein